MTHHTALIRHLCRGLAAIGLCAASLGYAQAPWPTAKPITLLVPFGAGGSLDGTTRLVAQHLSVRLGQSVAVENATGAGGAIGIGKAIAASPDGYTFLMAGDAPLVPGGPGESTYRFNMMKDLAPVVLVNTAPMVVVASPSVPAQNFTELVAYTRKNPGRLNYASSGIGTLPHLAMEMVKREAKLHVVHIPYRGGAQIANDVASKQIELAMLISASAVPSVRANLVKALAVTGDTRLPALPNVPTIAETTGFKGYNVVSWAGLYAPAKTPPEIVQRMASEVSEVLKLEAVKTKLLDQSILPQGGTPAAFNAFIEADRAQTGDILKSVSLKE
jgi:tripartite-type tricarboxylate transporter receptor subunit TctC